MQKQTDINQDRSFPFYPSGHSGSGPGLCLFGGAKTTKERF